MGRYSAGIMMVGLALLLAACGGSGAADTDADLESVGASSSGLGWIGERAIPLRGTSDRLRVIAFLRPDHAPSARVARTLGELARRHAELDIVGVTMCRDQVAVERFRSETGISYPVQFGLDSTALAAYGLQAAPAVQVVDERGVVVGRTLAALLARL